MSESLGAHMTVECDNNVHIVRFTDSKIVEESAIEEIAHRLAGLVESQPRLKLILDFSEVAHLSSGALGMLVTVYNEARKRKGRLRISSISPQMQEVFKITRLDRFFEVYSDTQAALVGFE